MSAGAQTKIFGIRVGLDPKILVAALVAVAGFLFWYNSRGDDDTHSSAATPARSAQPVAAPMAPTTAVRAPGAQRRRPTKDNRGTLRLRTVDATGGDIDPILRLDLLARLERVQQPSAIRNLFETGPAVVSAAQAGPPLPVRIIPVRQVPPPRVNPGYPIPSQQTANIPYKYYGFAKPGNAGEPNRGLFLDGDNTVVAAEGQVIDGRYLVVQLSATSARLEDTQIKLGQVLPVIPEANEQ